MLQVWKHEEWVHIDELFFQDLRATLDGVECGEVKKSLANRWIKMSGYKLNWKNYELKRVKNG